MNHFDRVAMRDIGNNLASVKATTCALDPCPYWMLKSCNIHINEHVISIINQSLSQGALGLVTQRGSYVPATLKTILRQQ